MKLVKKEDADHGFQKNIGKKADDREWLDVLREPITSTEEERRKALEEEWSKIEKINCLKAAAMNVFFVICMGSLLMGLYTEVLGAQKYLLLSCALLAVGLVGDLAGPNKSVSEECDRVIPTYVSDVIRLVTVAWIVTTLVVGGYGLFNDSTNLAYDSIYLWSTVGFGALALFVIK
ncbi:MAG: hypothetical protein ABW161_01135 [Candidatus Thiodiazotropha sp.]